LCFHEPTGWWQLDWDVTSDVPDKVHEPTPGTPEHANEVHEPTPGTLEHASEPSPSHRRWPWLVFLVLILAAVLGLVVGVGIVLRGRSFGSPLAPDIAARPTFVVSSQPSPSASPSPAIRPVATASDEYMVEAGDTLRSIAKQVYGDPVQWRRLYDANRETIGPDPDVLSAGTRLRVPRS
jgi:LysM repeat protein